MKTVGSFTAIAQSGCTNDESGRSRHCFFFFLLFIAENDKNRFGDSSGCGLFRTKSKLCFPRRGTGKRMRGLTTRRTVLCRSKCPPPLPRTSMVHLFASTIFFLSFLFPVLNPSLEPSLISCVSPRRAAISLETAVIAHNFARDKRASQIALSNSEVHRLSLDLKKNSKPLEQLLSRWKRKARLHRRASCAVASFSRDTIFKRERTCCRTSRDLSPFV